MASRLKGSILRLKEVANESYPLESYLSVLLLDIFNIDSTLISEDVMVIRNPWAMKSLERKKEFAIRMAQEREQNAKRYLEALGMSFDRIETDELVDYYGGLGFSEEGSSREQFERKMIPKVLELSRRLNRIIAIHVMAAHDVSDMAKSDFFGTAVLVFPGFLELIKNEYRRLAEDMSMIEGEQFSLEMDDNQAAKIFLQKFIQGIPGLICYGYKTRELAPSMPVSIFVDYDSGIPEKQGITEENYLFPWAIFSLDYTQPEQFEKRILHLRQWSIEELTIRDTQATIKSRPHYDLHNIIVEKYIDILLGIASKTLEDDAKTRLSEMNVLVQNLSFKALFSDLQLGRSDIMLGQSI